MNNISKYGLLVSLCLGYIVARTQTTMWYCQYGLIATIISVFMLISLLCYKTNWKYSGWFCLFSSYGALFLLGYIYYNMRYTQPKVESNTNYYVTSIVDTIPIHSQNLAYKVMVLNAYDTNLVELLDLPNPFYMNIYCKQDSSDLKISINDTLIIHADFHAYHNTTVPDAFDYDSYCLKQHILGWMYLVDSQWIKLASNNSNKMVSSSLDYCRNYCISRIDSLNLDVEKRHFLKSILLGDKKDLDQSLLDSFRVAGLAHILAISGLHIGLIYTILLFLLRIRFHRNWIDWLKQIVLISIVWLYVCIIGCPMSALRVAIMLTLVHIYRLFVESEWSSLHLLWLTAIGILIYEPEALFDLSFQFSFSAVLGLLLFIPKTNRWFALNHKELKKRNLFCYEILRKVFDFFCVCVVAQLFVAPLSIYYFHYFSLYFWLSALLLPVFTLILYGGILLLIPIPYVSLLIEWFENSLLSVLFRSSRVIANLPYAQMEIWWNKVELFLYFVLIGLLYFMLFSKSCCFRKRAMIGYGLVFVVLFWYHEYSAFSLKNRCETLLYQKEHVIAMNYLESCSNVVLCNDSSIIQYTPFKMYWKHRRACKPIYIITDSVAQKYLEVLDKK